MRHRAVEVGGMSLWKRAINWFRGYADADIQSLRDKLAANSRPGAIIYLTEAEMNALQNDEVSYWNKPKKKQPPEGRET